MRIVGTNVLRGLLLLLLLQTSPLAAQIEGRVRDELGQLVVGATVELWSESERLVAVSTDSVGVFWLTARPNGTSVRVFGLGVDPVSVPLGDLMRPLHIVLRPAPLELPGLEAAAARLTCPAQDDPAARVEWLNAATRYSSIPEGASWGAEVVERREGTTWADDFGDIPPASYAWSQVGARRSGIPGGGWEDEALVSGGYARLNRMGSLAARQDAWRYPPFDGAYTPHFASTHFAEAVLIESTSTEGDPAVFTFCSRDNDVPSVQGRAYLDDRGWIERIEWRITTPEPVESVGGEAFFEPASTYLLPASGKFWRKTPVGRYYQETSRFGRWYVGDHDGLRAFLRVRASIRRGEGG